MFFRHHWSAGVDIWSSSLTVLSESLRKWDKNSLYFDCFLNLSDIFLLLMPVSLGEGNPNAPRSLLSLFSYLVFSHGLEGINFLASSIFTSSRAGSWCGDGSETIWNLFPLIDLMAIFFIMNLQRNHLWGWKLKYEPSVLSSISFLPDSYTLIQQVANWGAKRFSGFKNTLASSDYPWLLYIIFLQVVMSYLENDIRITKGYLFYVGQPKNTFLKSDVKLGLKKEMSCHLSMRGRVFITKKACAQVLGQWRMLCVQNTERRLAWRELQWVGRYRAQGEVGQVDGDQIMKYLCHGHKFRLDFKYKSHLRVLGCVVTWSSLWFNKVIFVTVWSSAAQ